MLKIRQEQMQIFTQVAEQEMVVRFVNYLRRAHADQVIRVSDGQISVKELDQSLLGTLVERSLIRARSHGFDTESSLLVFTVLRFVSAPNFDEHEAVSTVLHNSALPVNSRIDALWRYTSEEHWEEIERHYDPQAW